VSPNSKQLHAILACVTRKGQVIVVHNRTASGITYHFQKGTPRITELKKATPVV